MLNTANWNDKQLDELLDLLKTADYSQVADFISQNFLCEGSKIMTDPSQTTLRVTVKVGDAKAVDISPGIFKHSGKVSQLDSTQTCNILVTSSGAWGTGKAAHPTYNRWSIICVKNNEQAHTPELRWFVDDTVDPNVYTQQLANTLINKAYYDIVVIHGEDAVNPNVPNAVPGYWTIAEIYVPAASGSILQSNIFDTGGNVNGPEKVTNGGFDDDSGWTKGANWTIVGGVASKSAGGLNNLLQDTSEVIGEIYKVTYTIVSISGGSLTVQIGGASGTSRSTFGTYTEYITALTTEDLTFVPSVADVICSIDNVSVKRMVESGSNKTPPNWTSTSRILRLEFWSTMFGIDHSMLTGYHKEGNWHIGSTLVTSTAVELNKLHGAGVNVNAANLNELTDGSLTILHNHGTITYDSYAFVVIGNKLYFKAKDRDFVQSSARVCAWGHGNGWVSCPNGYFVTDVYIYCWGGDMSGLHLGCKKLSDV